MKREREQERERKRDVMGEGFASEVNAFLSHFKHCEKGHCIAEKH